MKKWAIFLVSLWSLSNLMCGFGAYDFDQDLLPKTEPKPTDMAGIYLPTAETLSLITDKGGYNLSDISISLSAEGTFEMSNMPDWWHTRSGKSRGGADSGTGTWEIVQQNWWWQIALKFESRDFNSMFESIYAREHFNPHIDISGEQPPYSLWVYVGDLDKGRVMIFEQIIDNP